MSRSNETTAKTGPATAAPPRTKTAKSDPQPSAKKGKADEVPKRITKRERLIALLKTKGGVTIVELSKELDWQQHTTRAALTGLRKAGFGILVAKPDGAGAGHYSVSKTAAVRK